MAKPPESSKKSIFLAVGCLILIFGALSYFEFLNLKDIKTEQIELKKRISDFDFQNREVPKLKEEILSLCQEDKGFLELFPNQSGILEFYDDLEKFREKQGIKEWEYTRHEIKEKGERELQKIFFYTSFFSTFDQLGLLLNMIENHKYFFVIDRICVSQHTPSNDFHPLLKTEISFYTYLYNLSEDSNFQSLVKTYFPNNISIKKPTLQKNFYWDSTQSHRDPFSISEIISSNKVARTNGKQGNTSELDNIREKLKSVNKIYEEVLLPLSQKEDWEILDKKINEISYKESLEEIKEEGRNDQEILSRINFLEKEFGEWDKHVNFANFLKYRESQLEPLAKNGNWGELEERLNSFQYEQKIQAFASSKLSPSEAKKSQNLQFELREWLRNIKLDKEKHENADPCQQLVQIYRQKLLPLAKSEEWSKLESEINNNDVQKKLGSLLTSRDLPREKAVEILQIQQDLNKWLFYIKTDKESKIQKPKTFYLNAVYLNPSNSKYSSAWINSQKYYEGDSVEGYLLQEIKKDFVILKRDSKLYRLQKSNLEEIK